MVGRCCGASVLCVVLVLLLCLIKWLSEYCRSIYNVWRLRFRYHLEPGLLMYLETRLFIGVVVSHVAYCDHCVLCSFNVYALFCLMCSSISRLCYHQVFMICRSAGVVAICVKEKRIRRIQCDARLGIEIRRPSRTDWTRHNLSGSLIPTSRSATFLPVQGPLVQA